MKLKRSRYRIETVSMPALSVVQDVVPGHNEAYHNESSPVSRVVIAQRWSRCPAHLPDVLVEADQFGGGSVMVQNVVPNYNEA